VPKMRCTGGQPAGRHRHGLLGRASSCPGGSPPPPHTHTPQDKATAFPALLPNHVEMSYQLLMGVHLWPAMESYMPFFMDYDAAVRPGGSHGAAWLGLMPDQPDQSLRAA